jgi:hypothetical protein
VLIERLKIEQRDCAIKSEQTRRRLAEILSRPVALDLLNFDIREKNMEELNVSFS